MNNPQQNVPKVTVEQFHLNHHEPLQLKLLAGATGLSRRIKEGSVNRCGLAAVGFTKYFAYMRVQVIGSAEWEYLKSLGDDKASKRLEEMLKLRIPCLVFSRNINPPQWCFEMCEKYNIPLFKTKMVTMKFINAATILLELEFAPQGSELGSMVDILGIGVLIRGESGIGKSESVLGLIERGYSLVSDDVTRLRLFESKTLIGTSPEPTRYHMEIRGLGIINVRNVFGVASVRLEKNLNLVVTLMEWGKIKNVERVGLDREVYTILGIEVPHVTIPVRTGRDIAHLIEVAALDQKLKQLGENSAQQFNDQLIERMRASSP